jgi:hypothetical protein
LSKVSWPKGSWKKTDNIMAKGKLTKDIPYHGQRETDIQFPFGHDIVCLFSASFWPWYCLSFVSFPLSIKTDNIMSKGKLKKDKQYHGQREADKRETISWTKGSWQKTDNVFCQFPFGYDVVCLMSVSLCSIMAKRKLKKDRQYHCQRKTDKRHTISWTKGNWHKTDNIIAKGKLTKDFPLAMLLSVFCQFPFGHDIVCLFSVSLWPCWQKTDNNMAKGKLTKDRK